MTTKTTKTVTLTQSNWDTVRCALLCYASEQREVGNSAWSDVIKEVYAALKEQTF
jgi:hypothetical protein